ncbi:MAG: NrdJb, partial [Gammaproteobacteria bacterium]|nr:NrdJb [Gammaproteobacteria bacterium]
MTVKLAKKIVGFKVLSDKSEDKKEVVVAELAKDEPVVQAMNEYIERPEMLLGSTYKLKTPLSEHALYVTVNDIILNQGTDHEVRRPFEIFINS